MGRTGKIVDQSSEEWNEKTRSDEEDVVEKRVAPHHQPELDVWMIEYVELSQFVVVPWTMSLAPELDKNKHGRETDD